MLGHVREQLGVRFVSGEIQLAVCPIPSAQHIGRTRSEQAEYLAQLGHREGILPVVPVVVRNPSIIEQGDRLATRASGTCTDQLHSIGSHARDSTAFTVPRLQTGRRGF